MKIKRRHLQMARAARRIVSVFPMNDAKWAVVIWHRASNHKGRHQ